MSVPVHMNPLASSRSGSPVTQTASLPLPGLPGSRAGIPSSLLTHVRYGVAFIRLTVGSVSQYQFSQTPSPWMIVGVPIRQRGGTARLFLISHLSKLLLEYRSSWLITDRFGGPVGPITSTDQPVSQTATGRISPESTTVN